MQNHLTNSIVLLISQTIFKRDSKIAGRIRLHLQVEFAIYIYIYIYFAKKKWIIFCGVTERCFPRGEYGETYLPVAQP